MEGIIEKAGKDWMLGEDVEIVFVDSDRVGVLFAKSAARQAGRFQTWIFVRNTAILSDLAGNNRRFYIFLDGKYHSREIL